MPRIENLYRQFLSKNYARTEGTITHSEVIQKRRHNEETTPREKIIYDVLFEYRYEVNGLSLIGNRYRFNMAPKPSGDAARAERLAADHPVGSEVDVFYNPRNPTDAVLAQGVSGQDLALILVLTPFNCTAVGLWLIVFHGWGWKNFRRESAGARTQRIGQVISIRLPRWQPGLISVMTAAVSSFVSVFILGAYPALNTAICTFVILLALNAGVYLLLSIPIRSGEQDLVIDSESRTTNLPKSFGRKERIKLSFQDIDDIVVEIVQQQRKGVFSTAFAPVVIAGSAHYRLAKWWEKERAEALVKWLNTKLG